jgi:hypothetical protein
LAFLSRVTTSAVLPGWFLYAALMGRFRRLFSAPVLLAAVLYLATGVGYVKFASQYSKFEMSHNPTLMATQRFSWENASYYPVRLPGMVGWGSLAAALAGGACAVRSGRRDPSGLFWLSWIACYYAFQLVIATNFQRYFMFGLPALFGLIACLFDPRLPRVVARWVAPLAVGLALATNIVQSAQTPRGVLGYDAVARRLAELDRPGNVLVASPQFQDLIFHVRCREPRPPRRILRGDRTLAIRLSDYTGVPPNVLAHSREDVIDVVRRGRVRYLVTCAPADPRRDDRLEEMVLAHETACSSPRDFEPAWESPLLVEFDERGLGNWYRIFIWEYLGDLPDGSSEIPAVVPTAGMEIR